MHCVANKGYTSGVYKCHMSVMHSATSDVCYQACVCRLLPCSCLQRHCRISKVELRKVADESPVVSCSVETPYKDHPFIAAAAVAALIIINVTIRNTALAFHNLLKSEDDMTAQTPKLSDAVHLLMRPRLDVDTPRRCSKQGHDVLLHGRLEPGNLWSLQDQRHIDVSYLVTVSRHNFVGVLHELGRIAALPSWIGVLEDLADVRQGQSTEDPIDDGVVDDVAI
mmetsp:Transcript_24134/g.67288  ORF Transcript_24134/g.67288 Transcript_24134/m.67288 type:complete len:224 (-) Transcript_24134:482-1153(-)